MTYETHIKRDHYGKISAKTEIILHDVTVEGKTGKRILELTTTKGSRGNIWSYVSGSVQVGNMRTFMVYQEYQKTLINEECKRITEKKISEAHQKALTMLDVCIAEAREFYKHETKQGIETEVSHQYPATA